MEILSIEKRIDSEEGLINKATIAVDIASGLISDMERYVDGPAQAYCSVDQFVTFAIRDKIEQLDQEGVILGRIPAKSNTSGLGIKLLEYENIRKLVYERAREQ